MDKKQRAALEAVGYCFGDAVDFLGLTEPESKLIDFYLQVALGIRELREQAGLTHADLAKRLGLKVRKLKQLESGGPGVLLDDQLRVYFELGGEVKKLPKLGRRKK